MTASSTGTNSLRLTRIETPIFRLDSRAAQEGCTRSADLATADTQPVYQKLHEILAAGGVLGARSGAAGPFGQGGKKPIAIAEEGHGGVFSQPRQHAGKHRVRAARCFAFPEVGSGSGQRRGEFRRLASGDHDHAGAAGDHDAVEKFSDGGIGHAAWGGAAGRDHAVVIHYQYPPLGLGQFLKERSVVTVDVEDSHACASRTRGAANADDFTFCPEAGRGRPWTRWR